VGEGSSVGTGISVGDCATPLLITADDICIPESIAEGIAEGTGIAEKSGPEEETFIADDERSIAEEIGPSILRTGTLGSAIRSAAELSGPADSKMVGSCVGTGMLSVRSSSRAGEVGDAI